MGRNIRYMCFKNCYIKFNVNEVRYRGVIILFNWKYIVIIRCLFVLYGIIFIV